MLFTFWSFAYIFISFILKKDNSYSNIPYSANHYLQSKYTIYCFAKRLDLQNWY